MLLLFLDVDGVLNPTVGKSATGAPRLTVSKRKTNLVQKLSSLGDIVWCSSWPYSVLTSLGRELGIGMPDAVPLRLAEMRGETSKTRDIDRWLTRKRDSDDFVWDRIVWIDDSIDAAAQEWAAEFSVPTMLICPNPELGLTEDDVDSVVVFLQRSESGTV